MRRAAVARKALADKGLVHHPEHRRALVQQRDQRAPDRKARDEGFGAVDRIQHPDIFGVFALAAEFLADNAMLGKLRLDQPPHHRFRGAIGFGYRIEVLAVAFIVDAQRSPKERQDGFPGGGREAADEGCKIDDRHDGSLRVRSGRRKSWLLPSPILQVAHGQRTSVRRRYQLFLGLRISPCIDVFWMPPVITSTRVPGQ